MRPAQHPREDAGTLSALRRYAVIDTPAEAAFDDITELAAQVCATPIALISIVDRGRIWVKSRVGIEISDALCDIAFWTSALQGRELMEVPDTLSDPRFRDSPLVTGEHRIRSCTGTPLIAPEGSPLGALCVLDNVPRRLTPEQARALEALGRQVVRQLEMRAVSQQLAHLSGHLEEVVTERTARLQATEARLCAALDAASDGFWEWTIAPAEVYFSPQWIRILGYSHAAVPLRLAFYRSIIHPDDREAVRRDVEACLAGRKDSSDLTIRLRRKDGEYLVVQARGKVVARDPDGTPLRMAGTLSDIAGRVRAETELRESERRLREAQQMAHLGSWEGDPVTSRMTWSDELFRIFEMDPATAIPSFELVASRAHPDDMPLVLKTMEQIMTGPGHVEVEHRIQMPDGRVKHILVQGEVVYGRDGTRSMRGTTQDVTARALTDQALRASEERFRLLVEHASGAFFLHAADGRLLDVNRQACETLGYSREELLAMNVADIEHSLAGDGLRRLWNELPLDQVVVLQGRHRCKNGSVFPVEVRCRLFERDGRRLFLAIVTDITDRLRLEEQLRQAQKMEAIGRLAGGIAHDFNNILMVMNGYSDMLLSQLMPGDPLRDPITEIGKAGRRAADLTRQLLIFSRKQVTQPKVLNLNHLVEDLKALLSRLIREDIELDIRLEPNLGMVMADSAQLTQLIMNLVVNARDAMRTGGLLTISTSNSLESDSFPGMHPEIPPGSWVVLTVADSGCGMDPEERARAFEPFFTTKAAGEGTGMGLATVYGVVRQAGGVIQVDSQKGRGTTFRTFLPRIADAVQPGDPASPDSAPRGSETILVVEDEKQILQLVASFLRRQGYRVLTAPNGHDALQRSADCPGPIDLLLTDVVMPGMSGQELASRIRHLRPQTRIAYFSGHTVNSLVMEEMRKGLSAYIHKPVSLDELTAFVREVLDSPPPPANCAAGS